MSEKVNGVWQGASDEPISIIEANECQQFNSLATSRFRRLINEIAALQAQLSGARNAALEEAIDSVDDDNNLSSSQKAQVTRNIRALMSSPAPDQSAEMLATSSIDHQQRRGVAWDIIDQAINTYDGWMLDDDYQAGRVLREIIEKMKERRAAFNAQKDHHHD